MEEYSLTDFIRCKRCSKNFIFEEYDEHICDINFKGIKEIGIDYHFEGGRDKNNDLVFMAKGLDGMIYRLVKCNHNPPHTSLEPIIFDRDLFRSKNNRKFTDDDSNHGLYEALKQQTYKVLVPYYTVWLKI